MNDDIVRKLCDEMMQAIRAHYLAQAPGRPPSQEKVYEVLNALGICAGVVLAGCNDPRADEFFQTAVRNQRADSAADPRTAAPAPSPWRQ